MRDVQNRLLCGKCHRPIPGLTGLDEIQNMIAHYTEHHGTGLTMDEALELRIVWERS